MREVGITASENRLCTVAVVVVVVVVVVEGIPVAKICLRGPVNVKRNHIIHSIVEVFFFSLWDQPLRC